MTDDKEQPYGDFPEIDDDVLAQINELADSDAAAVADQNEEDTPTVADEEVPEIESVTEEPEELPEVSADDDVPEIEPITEEPEDLSEVPEVPEAEVSEIEPAESDDEDEELPEVPEEPQVDTEVAELDAEFLSDEQDDTPQDDDRVAALEDRIAVLEEMIEEVSSRPMILDSADGFKQAAVIMQSGSSGDQASECSWTYNVYTDETTTIPMQTMVGGNIVDATGSNAIKPENPRLHFVSYFYAGQTRTAPAETTSTQAIAWNDPTGVLHIIVPCEIEDDGPCS